MTGPTRQPNGITTASKTEPLGDFILPDMTKAHIYMEDFDYYTAADWIVTEVGTASQALSDAEGGRLLITNSASNDDSSFQQKVGESFLFQTRKKLWFDCFFEINDAIESDFIIGLQITDTTPLSVSDGVYFIKNDDGNTIDFVVVKDSISTITTAIDTIGSATFKKLSFFYDGVDSIKIFSDGVQIGTSATDNLPDDEILTISFGIQNGDATPTVMSVDYIMAAKER